MPDFQNEVINYLGAPSTYSHTVEEVIHLETHISHIFLAGEFVYKVKKPVKFDFLDFTTLEKRKLYCERELELNSRFAPEIYLEVVCISRFNNQLTFEKKGPPVEYAVKMKRFDNDSLWSDLVSRGELENEQLEQLAGEIASFHKKAETKSSFWGPEQVHRVVLDNVTCCREVGADFLDLELLSSLEKLYNSLLEDLAPLIAKRQAIYVRAVHGDLHLGNICMFKGKPTLFDGIEFNDNYSCCDVWADIAFLIMDLGYRKHPEYANIIINTYLEETDDFEGLELLPLYLSYRAAVRAKVSCLSVSSVKSEKEKESLKKDTIGYLSYAKNILLKRASSVIAIGGLSGSGKSTLAKALAPKIKAVIIRSDAVRKHLAGVSLRDKAPEEVYSSDTSEKVYEGMLSRAGHVIKAGGSVILDATYLKPQERQVVSNWCNENKVSFIGFWCNAPRSVLVERLEKRVGDVSDADTKILEIQLSRNLGEVDWQIVDSSGSPLKEVLAVIS